MTASRPTPLLQIDARGPCSKAGIIQLEQEGDLTYPWALTAISTISLPGLCCLCSTEELCQGFVFPLDSPGNSKQASLAHYSRSPKSHTSLSSSPPPPDFFFFSTCSFIQCSWVLFPVPREAHFWNGNAAGKKAGGYRLQGPSPLPLVILPVKCHPSGALSDSPPKYFPRCCPVLLLPH